jgi:hypothetical protein
MAMSDSGVVSKTKARAPTLALMRKVTFFCSGHGRDPASVANGRLLPHFKQFQTFTHGEVSDTSAWSHDKPLRHDPREAYSSIPGNFVFEDDLK